MSAMRKNSQSARSGSKAKGFFQGLFRLLSHVDLAGIPQGFWKVFRLLCAR